jgi:hypothetical protein
VRGLEARPLADQPRERLHEQASPDEQDQRERDLPHHQGLPRAEVRGAGPSLFEGSDQ